MDDMILNKNDCGIVFEDDELTWDLTPYNWNESDSDTIPYSKVLEALKAPEKLEEISVSTEESIIWETDSFEWEVTFGIDIFKCDNVNNDIKYQIRVYTSAVPYPYSLYNDISDLSDEEDFADIMQQMSDKVDKDREILVGDDDDFSPEGDLTGKSYETYYATMTEAFEQLPIIIEQIYRFLELKGQVINLMLEHYE